MGRRIQTLTASHGLVLQAAAANSIIDNNPAFEDHFPHTELKVNTATILMEILSPVCTKVCWFSRVYPSFQADDNDAVPPQTVWGRNQRELHYHALTERSRLDGYIAQSHQWYGWPVWRNRP